ncbi:AAA family ATPase, partial [Streptomyces mirabilis]
MPKVALYGRPGAGKSTLAGLLAQELARAGADVLTLKLVRVVDAYGAEHLEIQTADAAAVADRVKNAGAI